jgi:hypothetical protein
LSDVCLDSVTRADTLSPQLEACASTLGLRAAFPLLRR